MDQTIERKLLNLAAELAEANDNAIPRLLLQLNGIACEAQGEALAQVKQSAWQYDILSMLALALQQDFTRLTGAWHTAQTLVHTLCTCCVGLDPEGEAHEFYEQFLPAAVENILALVRKLQTKFMKTSSMLEDVRARLLSHISAMLGELAMLLGAHPALSVVFVACDCLLQLMMAQDAATCTLVMATLQSAIRVKRDTLGLVETSKQHALLDELVYTMSATSAAGLAAAACRTIVVMAEAHAHTLCERYTNLKPVLSRWQGKGFDGDLCKLVDMFRAECQMRAKHQRVDVAACVIQAFWKGWLTRRRLRRADAAFTVLQRNFRARRDQRQKAKSLEQQLQMEQERLQLHQRRAMRQLHTRQLHTLTALPPGDVERHVREERAACASRIQAAWRGHVTRRATQDMRATTKRTRAALRIQRAVRRWLERGRAWRASVQQRPPGLTDDQRVELQHVIQAWKEVHLPVTQGAEARRLLHEQVQRELRQHAATNVARHRTQQRREALLARLQLDGELLLSAPRLCEVTPADVAVYKSNSGAVATRARHCHAAELRLQKAPWWRRLGDKYQDEKAMTDAHLMAPPGHHTTEESVETGFVAPSSHHIL